jgi:hypothetical protein
MIVCLDYCHFAYYYCEGCYDKSWFMQLSGNPINHVMIQYETCSSRRRVARWLHHHNFDWERADKYEGLKESYYVESRDCIY